METNVPKKITEARSAMILDSPFYGATVLKLNFQESNHNDTMWVDGVTLGYSPEFITNTDIYELKLGLKHEALHCIFGHHVRRNNKDITTWREACDYFVNNVLHKDGDKIPEDWLFDSSFDGMSEDKIYDVLYGRKQKDGDSDQKQQDNQNQDQQNGQNSNSSAQNDQQQQQDNGQGTPQSDQQGPNDQQQGQGQGQGQENAPQGKSCGELCDYPGPDGDKKLEELSQAELDQQAQEWQIAATQSAKQAESCGKMPGNMAEEVEILNQEKVDWRSVLQRFAEEAAATDWSYVKPNRRFADCDFILPSLHEETLPPMIVAMDSSGSMSNDDLKLAGGEIENILETYDVEVQVIYCDTNVRETQTFTKADIPIKLDAKGRGGTRFSPLFKHVNQMDVEPVCVIYFSDMDCYDFGPEPDYPVLWIQTEGRRTRDVPFGEIINMD